jgi:hypothetical protein
MDDRLLFKLVIAFQWCSRSGRAMNATRSEDPATAQTNVSKMLQEQLG